MTARISAISIIATLLGLLAQSAAASGDPTNGLKLARQWCSSCHQVEQKPGLHDMAPTFSSIAGRRNKAWVKAWLSNPHPPMTGIDLSRTQIDDITAYIQSLAKPNAD